MTPPSGPVAVLERATLGRRVTLGNGQTVRTVGTWGPPADRQAVLAASGLPTPLVHELHPSEAPLFRAMVAALADPEGNRFHACISPYSVGDYATMRLFVTADGSGGCALHGDEMVSGFSYPSPGKKPAARSLLATLVSLGGRRLECFDTVLPWVYALEGMVVVARTRFFEEGLPPGWDLETYADFNNGRPDTVFMAFDPAALDGAYIEGSGTLVSTNTIAHAAVRDFLTGA